MSESRDLAYLYIEAERLRQDKIWGEQNHGDERWQGILGEEFGEVCKAINERELFSFDYSSLRSELTQVAAVAIAWIEAIDRRG